MKTLKAQDRDRHHEFGRILVVGDEPDFVDSLCEVLVTTGFPAETTTDPREALDRVTRGDYALVIVDLVMPEMDGMEVLRRTRAVAPDTEVVIVTGYGTVETAVEAIRAGAADFITKPFESRRIIEVIGRVMELRRLRMENRRLREELAGLSRGESLPSAAMRDASEVARELALVSVPVLLLGENGSGRRALAELMHRGGPRSTGPLVKMNCSALPRELHEAELFGTAGNGADRRAGRLELAAGGTLLIEEVDCLSAAAQERLAVFLRQGCFPDAGSDWKPQPDVRLVASAARADAPGLADELREILASAVIAVPALRDRPEDVPVLAHRLLETAAGTRRGASARFSPETLQMMSRYRWPGNVRELESVVERAAVFAGDEGILPEHLPVELRTAAADPGADGISESDEIPRPLAEIEREAIEAALRRSKGNLSRTARELGVSRTSLYDRIARYKLPPPEEYRTGHGYAEPS